TVRDERGVPAGTGSDRTARTRAKVGRGGAASPRADVAAATAVAAKRCRSGVIESGSYGSDTRADAARDGGCFGGADGKSAVSADIGRPALERLFDTGFNLIPGAATAGGTADGDRDIPDSGVDRQRASIAGGEAGVVGQATMRGVAAGMSERGSDKEVFECSISEQSISRSVGRVDS